MRRIARPIALVLLTVTLCGLAIGEAFGCQAPTWFLTMAIPIVVGLMVERAIRKNKGGE